MNKDKAMAALESGQAYVYHRNGRYFVVPLVPPAITKNVVKRLLTKHGPASKAMLYNKVGRLYSNSREEFDKILAENFKIEKGKVYVQ